MRIEKCGNIFTKEKNHAGNIICVLLFAFAVILKFGYYRFSYFPLLDDHIQYGLYHLYDKSHVLFEIGTLYTRPLAAICDTYLWGLFKDNLSIVFIIITIMHFSSAFLFKRAFEKADIYCGNLFLIFYLLSPILSEALYWISASARIVPGLLFCALSINFLFSYFKSKKIYLWLLTFLTHFISYGFYEQTLCLSFGVFMFLVFADTNIEKRTKVYSLAIPIICVVFYTVYYFIFRNLGSLAYRGEISFSAMPSTAKRIFRIFTLQNFELTANGFIRGIKLLTGSPFYLLLIFGVSTAFLFLPRERFKPCARKLILSAVILVSSYIPYFIIKGSYPEFRSMYSAVFALGLVLDCAGDRFRLKNVLCSVLAFIFITANVLEIYDYKTVYDIDKRIIDEIVASGKLDEKSDIYVTGVKEHYSQVNSRLGTHISGITSSDWALTGAVRNRTQNPRIKRLIPVYEKETNDLPKINIGLIK